jgi:hypothetical protein
MICLLLSVFIDLADCRVSEGSTSELPWTTCRRLLDWMVFGPHNNDFYGRLVSEGLSEALQYIAPMDIVHDEVSCREWHGSREL